MALLSCLLVSVSGRRSQLPGPSPTLESFGPSHQQCHKSQVSLRGPSCAHGILGTPHGEVHDNNALIQQWLGCGSHDCQGFNKHNFLITYPNEASEESNDIYVNRK